MDITHLSSGGLITNYYCSSSCAHCLYNCSPLWPKDFISPEQTIINLKKLKSLGCNRIHIGGGEPLLAPEKLFTIIDVIYEEEVEIDYIETNSSWFNDETKGKKILNRLLQKGIKTLLISISPFHNEFIPFEKVKKLIECCQETGMGVFHWIEGFIKYISPLDHKKVHSPKEYKILYGEDFWRALPELYWLSLRGRALKTYAPLMKPIKTDKIIKSSLPCAELEDTSHFHMDLYGNYIPGLCSGISIPVDKLGEPLDSRDFLFLNILNQDGVGRLASLAQKDYAFIPNEEYVSKCALCYHIRHWLVVEKKHKSPEFEPGNYYNMV